MYKSNRSKNDKIKRPKLRPEHVIIKIDDQKIKDFRTLLNINYKKWGFKFISRFFLFSIFRKQQMRFSLFEIKQETHPT